MAKQKPAQKQDAVLIELSQGIKRNEERICNIENTFAILLHELDVRSIIGGALAKELIAELNGEGDGS